MNQRTVRGVLALGVVGCLCSLGCMNDRPRFGAHSPNPPISVPPAGSGAGWKSVRTAVSGAAQLLVERVRAADAELPVCVGLGVSNTEQAAVECFGHVCAPWLREVAGKKDRN